jgi:hypothetical protein
LCRALTSAPLQVLIILSRKYDNPSVLWVSYLGDISAVTVPVVEKVPNCHTWVKVTIPW